MLRALAAELEHRSAAELAERIARRGEAWTYRTEDVKNATAVAITIVRRGYECPDVRCEDHHRLDTGQPCGHCAEATPATASASGNSRTAAPRKCEACNPFRRLEDADGNDVGPCPTCHPAAASASA